MLVSLNWIKKFTDVELTTEELLQRVASRIAEIESVADLSKQYVGIVVAEIAEASEHPEADKLGVYQINIGDQRIQVVAGDKTLKPGDKTAYLPPGATVPGTFNDKEPFVISKVKLRGVESNGMMASGKELGWGNNHERVLKLDTNFEAGTSLIQAYELDDLIIEIENKTLTHRPDCFGLIGFAREIAGVQDIQFQTPDWYLEAIKDVASDEDDVSLSVSLPEPEMCRRFSAIAMKGVKVANSPQVMQSYLERLGVKAINNIVDITNYLTLSTGQPLHAFDLDKLAEISDQEGSFVVRFPSSGEKITLLNGKTIEPYDKALMICTDTTPADMAGIMGGSETEVDENSTRIMLSACSFDLYNIRRTSMKHGLFTEAVTRFIRGQSADQTWPVIWQAANLVNQLAGGKVVADLDEYPTKHIISAIEVSKDKVNQLLGSEYDLELMAKTLRNVEFKVDIKEDNLMVTAPFWRNDIHIAEDVVEEIGRLLGYGSLQVTLPGRSVAAVDLEKRQKTRLKLRDLLSSSGAKEMYSYNFVSKDLYEKLSFDQSNAYEIRNSISPELEFMRMSLIPSILTKVNGNIRAGYDEFVLFEINKSHRKSYVDQGLPIEDETVAAVFASAKDLKGEGFAYYQAKKYADLIADEYDLANIEYVDLVGIDSDDWLNSTAQIYNPSRSAIIKSGNAVIGILGEFKASVGTALKLPEHCSGLELRLDALENSSNNRVSNYSPLSKYPSTQQDVTFEISDEVSHAALKSEIENSLAATDLQLVVKDRDIYRADSNSKRRITFRVTLTHMQNTLTTDQVNEKISNMANKVIESCGAQLI